MKQGYLILVFAGILIISACRWESEEDIVNPCNSTITWASAPTDTCFDLPINGLGYVDAVTHWPYIYVPYYCPVDAQRFMYWKVHEGENEININISNLCTGDNHIVTATNYLNYPQWGTSDWIIFGSGFGPLYKVKSNGDSLSTLTPNNSVITNYMWINDGDEIYTSWKDGVLNHNYILNLNGEIVDTILLSIAWGSYRNSQIAAISAYQNILYIGIANTVDWQFTPLIPLDSGNLISPLNWLDENTLVWSDYDGIHTLNILTSQISTIKTTPCENMRYTSVSAAPDNSGKILTTRLEYIYVKPDSLVEYQRISLLDTNTGQEWILGLE